MIKIYSFNVHPGLLPYYPGTNSISGALYNNEKTTGITIHLINEKLDGGNICLVKKIKIRKNELAINLWIKILRRTPELINKLISKLENNKLRLYKNNYKKIKKFPSYIPKNGKIFSDIQKKELLRMYRANYYFPFKSSWGQLNFTYKKKKYHIIKLDPTNLKSNNFLEKINSKQFILNIKKSKFLATIN